jgi:hypothetical protein
MASNTRPKMPVSRQSQIPAVTEQSFPARFIDCMTAHRQGAALKAAIELDLFTVLAEGGQTCESLALRLQAATPDGDAYTHAEFQRMFRDVGFRSAELHEIPPSPQRVVISRK